MSSLDALSFFNSLFENKNLIEPLVSSTEQTDVLRLDALDATINGNKPFKLMGHIDDFCRSHHHSIVSFGGVYSNHLHALGAVCHQFSIPFIAYVRGYENLPLTPTLKDLSDWESKLYFLNKLEYKNRDDPDFIDMLSDKHNAYVVPEGGGGQAGLKGGQALANLCQNYEHIWIAAGTGTTALSLAPYLKKNVRLHVVNVVADAGALKHKLAQDMPINFDWSLYQASDYPELGAFGKCSDALKAFITHWDKKGLTLDSVYTAKLLWVYLKQVNKHPKTLLIHSGGLQGRRGLSL